MLIEHQHPHNKSIMVGVLGIPNAGKSSLINAMIGYDLSAVTRLPQTTRNQFHCTAVYERTEVVFVDTPGLHFSHQEINKRMVGQAKEGVSGADLSLWLVDLSRNLNEQFELFRENFPDLTQEVWVVFTKSDVMSDYGHTTQSLTELVKTWQYKNFFIVSSSREQGLAELKNALIKKAPNAPHLYPAGDASNKNERFFVAEYIREQAFLILKEELPYEIAVVVDEYKNVRPDEQVEHRGFTAHISASILVNRTSQRAIVVGSKGGIIKEIGTRARKKIEAMVGHQIFLNLHVKVSPKWFKNNLILEELGLPRVGDSTRVWRKKA